jgi:hypothetical protein
MIVQIMDVLSQIKTILNINNIKNEHMKTSIVKHALLLSAVIIFSYGCKKDNGNTDNGRNELITNGGNITVKGTSNYEFEVELEGAYIITFKEKAIGDLQNVEIYIEVFGGWTDWMPGGIMALRSDNWYEGSTIQSYSERATLKFKATASGQFEVTFEKLPLSKATVNLPQSYTGAGSTFFGPVSISGNATFDIVCSDANQTAFTVNILDAITGAIILNSDNTILYTNYSANQGLTNNISTTITKPGISGTYLIWVCANGNADYTLGIH